MDYPECRKPLVVKTTIDRLKPLMKRISLAGPAAGLLLFGVLHGCVQAQQTTAPAGSAPDFSTPVASNNLDPAAFAEWENGVETAVTGPNKPRGPGILLWAQGSEVGFSNFNFGDSKRTGPRYLRFGFKTAVPVGSVLARGGGALSVLKPDAAYPGDLSDDSQWIPAQRLVDGQLSTTEATREDEALWVLPPGTTTRALRFTHVAGAADNTYAGWLGGAMVYKERLINLAPFAQAVTSSNGQKAKLINNAEDESWGRWENLVADDSPVVNEESAPTAMLVWPEPVKLNAVVALNAGFGSADVQMYTGPADRHPRDASEADWKTIKSFSGLKNGYPTSFWPNRLDFGQTVTTRAVRVRMTSVTQENHPHLNGRTKGGKQVWLAELVALQPLADSPLKTVSFDTAADAPHPPIPVRFKLDKPGYVTLVVEGMSGKRVRNLVSETFFPAGDNVVWWDGTDDLGRDVDAARHGLYRIPTKFVVPGAYKVRGLVHDAISLNYEFPVYTGGNPPWSTPDHAGAWLSNHTPPQAALFVPAGNSPTDKDAVLLGSAISEGRDGLAWVDLDGRKLGGKTWVGGIWTGSAYLARDTGPQPVGTAYAYSASAWQGDLRLTGLGPKDAEKAVPGTPWKFPGATDQERKDNTAMAGLAVYNGRIAVSLPKQGQLLYLDQKAGAAAATVPLKDPRGLAYDASGKLLALAGTRLVRFDSPNDTVPVPVVETGLEDPHGIVLDGKGNIYISDWGQSHQVKVFDGNGKLVRTIGHAGAPKAGPYDPQHMNAPDGMAVDSKNQLWVTENDFLPKRVSVWSLDGQFIKAFYGPSKYGGGGTLDPGDKTRFLYADESHGTMEFKLDWQKGTFELANVLYRPGAKDLSLPFRGAAPETPLYRDGKRYLTNCFNSSPTGGHGTALIFLQRDGLLQPVAAAGRANQWPLLKGDAFKPNWPAGTDLNANNAKGNVFFLWSDANFDGQVQPAEVSWKAGDSGGVTVMPDLSFCISRLDGKAIQFAPTVAPNGVPAYDINAGKVLADGVQRPASSGGDQLLTDGTTTILSLGVAPYHTHSLSGLKGGEPMWSYPSLWPGLHASHEAAKPDHPGEVIGSTRLLGGFVNPKGSDVGPLWGINANMGNAYLFTADGLFVSTLFEDSRVGQPWKMPQAQRNMKLDGITLHDENFWPTLTQAPDGQVYMVDGGNTSLIRVDGLASLRAIAASTIRVSADELTAAQNYVVDAEIQRQKAQGRGVLEVSLKPQAPTVDGKLDDWKGAPWVDIDKSGVGANFNSDSKPYDITAAVTISGDRLYAAYRTGNKNLLANSGEMATAPFKTGGALDLMLGTDPKADPKRDKPVQGDIRLLVTMVQNKPKALIYRAVVPGTTNPVPFSSPWRTITLDKVDDVSGEVQLAGTDGNYEISVPLAALGLKADGGEVLRGDVGVLRGDGSQTLARTYWSNKATGITADVPSEAMLTPQLWGEVQLKAEG